MLRFVKNLKISNKLILVFSFQIVLMLTIAFVSIFNFKQMQKASEYSMTNGWGSMPIIIQMQKEAGALRVNIRDVVIHTDMGKMKEDQKSFLENQAKLDSLTKSYSLTLADSEDSANFTAFKNAMADWQLKANEVFDYGLKNQSEAAQKELANILPKAMLFNKTLENLGYHCVEISQNLQKENEQSSNKAMILIVSITVFAIVISVVLLWFMNKLITNPILEASAAVAKVARGELDIVVQSENSDEVGDLMNSLGLMTQNLNGIVGKIRSNSDSLASSAEELSVVSNQLTSNSQSASSQANSISVSSEEMGVNISTMAAAAEEMSVNSQTVASSAEQMATNIIAVSAAVEEMSITIGTISQSAGQSIEISNKAALMSKHATETMSHLGVSAKEVGKVTDMIKHIAEKTNLLALNATIEAASAGEAGKGFAVVANEIKELANQSSKAAEDITQRIEGIQGSTQDAIKVIEEVAQIIAKVLESIQSISVSVDQQSRASQEISANVGQASQGAQHITTSISEVAKGASEMAQNSGSASCGVQDVVQSIGSMSHIISQNANGSEQVNVAARELAVLASGLRELLKGFKI